MVEIIIDQSAIEALAILLAPSVGWVITAIKKRLATHQGNMAYSKFKERANKIMALAEKFPETRPLAEEYRETMVNAELLWKDPKDNSEELAKTLEHGDKLLSEIFKEIEKYAPVIEKIIHECMVDKK